MNNEIYKKGDQLICLPNFDKSESSGGAGYEEGFIITVKDISRPDADPDKRIYWPGINGNGVYGKACRLYQKAEVNNNYEIY